jgi:class 3 adenylate cyclase
MADTLNGHTTPHIPKSKIMVVMFTDIEGATHLKTKHGDDAFRTSIFEPHNQLFETIINSFDQQTARIVKTTGDGYLAVFELASDAVIAALRFQHALSTYPWLIDQPRVRVGIHTGQATWIQEGDKFDVVGLAVDLAARVMDLAIPGQNLLTHTSYEGAHQFVRTHPDTEPDRPPLNLKWVSHGRYIFRGDENVPLDIYEVGVENVSPLKPPPRSPKARRTRNRFIHNLTIPIIIVTVALALGLRFYSTTNPDSIGPSTRPMTPITFNSPTNGNPPHRITPADSSRISRMSNTEFYEYVKTQAPLKQLTFKFLTNNSSALTITGFVGGDHELMILIDRFQYAKNRIDLQVKVDPEALKNEIGHYLDRSNISDYKVTYSAGAIGEKDNITIEYIPVDNLIIDHLVLAYTKQFVFEAFILVRHQKEKTPHPVQPIDPAPLNTLGR